MASGNSSSLFATHLFFLPAQQHRHNPQLILHTRLPDVEHHLRKLPRHLPNKRLLHLLGVFRDTGATFLHPLAAIALSRIGAEALPELRKGLGDKTALVRSGSALALGWMGDEEGEVATLLERHGVQVQGSAESLKPLVEAVLAEHPGAVRQYLAGKTATLGFLVGQVMKRSGGQAVPQVVQELLREALEQLAT